jgi:hypothetical protein
MAMIDPSFGEIEFSIDAWDGLAPFVHDPSGSSEFALHIWADQSGPTDAQRATFDRLKARYPALWPLIAGALLDCHPDLNSVEEVARALNPVVGCYLEDAASEGHSDFELVYTFDLAGEDGRGFFVRFIGWRIVETVLAT